MALDSRSLQHHQHQLTPSAFSVSPIEAVVEVTVVAQVTHLWHWDLALCNNTTINQPFQSKLQ